MVGGIAATALASQEQLRQRLEAVEKAWRRRNGVVGPTAPGKSRFSKKLYLENESVFVPQMTLGMKT
jgi:hypothetical protein